MGEKKKLRILQNFRRENLIIRGFRGRDITFGSKAKRIFNMNDEEERSEYYEWQTRFGKFSGDHEILGDISSRHPEITNVYPKPEVEPPRQVDKKGGEPKIAVPAETRDKIIPQRLTKEDYKNTRIIFR